MATLTIYTGKAKPFIFNGTEKECDYVRWLYDCNVWRFVDCVEYGASYNTFLKLKDMQVLQIEGNRFKLSI